MKKIRILLIAAVTFLIVVHYNKPIDLTMLSHTTELVISDENQEEILRVNIDNPEDLFGSGYIRNMVAYLSPNFQDWIKSITVGKKPIYFLKFLENDKVLLKVEILSARKNNSFEGISIVQWLSSEESYVLLRSGNRIFSFPSDFYYNFDLLLQVNSRNTH